VLPPRDTLCCVKSPPVQFDRPPVAEVACGVMFAPLGFKTVHVGLLWQRFQAAFPRVEEAPPIAKVIENPANAFGEQQIELNFQGLPEMRRSWFLDKSGGALIQVQEDRFLFNWKRVEVTDPYPSYDKVIAEFEKHLAVFVSFLKETGLGAPNFRQFELTYINLIGDQNGLREVRNSNALSDHNRQTESRFLPEPESFNWMTHYLLPNNWGRLHITAQTAALIKTREKVLRLEFCARGHPSDQGEGGRRAWFDTAHEWITHGFADSTVPALHKIWQRKA
jgi:uncharacterized protein (TIGR04255 family)